MPPPIMPPRPVMPPGRVMLPAPLMPPGSIIGGLVRGERFLQAHHDTVIERDDHVIVFVTNRRHVREVEMLFRARPTAI